MEKVEEMESTELPPPATTNESQPVPSLNSKLFKQFICHFCGMQFDEKTHLRQHIGHKHLPKDQKCPDCDVMINSISIVSHQQIHRKKHICEKCGRLFQTQKRLEAHMEKLCFSKTREALEQDPEFLAKKKFKCIICVYRGPNERALNKHIHRVHRAKNMEKEKTCEICDKKFTKLAYIYHIRSHGRVQCKICHKFLSTGSGFLKQHMANHKKEEEEPSDPKSFEKALGSDGIFRCYSEGCDYNTHKKRLFVRHFQNLHGPKSLKCDYPGCESGLMSEKQLWRHKNSHKRKDCEKCGAIFNELRDLNRHLANDVCKDIDKSNVKPNSEPIHDLKCPKCDYTTYQSNSLTRHRLMNHATLVGQCTYPGCQNKEKMTKFKLAIHLRRHTEPVKKSRRKYTCDYCGIVITGEKNLEKHMETCEEKEDMNENSESENKKIKHEDEEMIEDSFDDQKAKNMYENEPKSQNPEENNIPPDITKVKVEPDTESISMDNNEDFISSQIKLEPEVELHELIDGEAFNIEPFDHDQEDIFSENNEETSENPLEIVATFEKDYPIKCTKCDFRTEKKKYLTNHMATMHDPNPTKCPFCDKFVSRALFNKHLATHERKFECHICNRNFATGWKLKDHNLRHHPEIIDPSNDDRALIGHLEDLLGDAIVNPQSESSDEASVIVEINEEPKEQHSCTQCDYKTTNIHEFRCHVIDHKKILPTSNMFSCDQCYYLTHKKKNLDYHIIMVHDPQTVKCHVCEKQINKRRFKKHLKTHTREFSCKLCGKQTSTRWNLKVHINKVHPDHQDLIEEINEESRVLKQVREKPPPVTMQCDHCEYTTDDKRSFTNHFWRVHSVTRWTCHLCGKSVSWVDQNRHLATHENPAQKTPHEYMCEKCSKVFAQKRSLEVHTLSCDGIIRAPVSQQFKCDICSFATGSKKSLRNHKYMVHAPKDCECPHCHKVMTKARFSGHIKWHENRLTCSLCQKDNFASRWHLKVHILKVHPGNEKLMQDEGLVPSDASKAKQPKMAVCPECGKEVRENKLSSHMLIHNKQVQCDFEGCVKMFAHKYAQRSHMKKAHKIAIKEEIVDGEKS